MAANQWYDIDYQWVDVSYYEWTFDGPTGSGVPPSAGIVLYHVCLDDYYAYSATSIGIVITDLETETTIAYIRDPASPDYPTVSADDNYVYVGTTNAGVKRLSKIHISAGGNLYTYLSEYASEPWITSNTTVYMHGNDNNLILCTAGGVDVIRKKSMYVSSNTSIVGTLTKCFATENDYYYYVVNNNNVWTINKLNGNSSDWTTADKTYIMGYGLFNEATEVTDIYVTAGTSTNCLDNTLFVATNSGIYVYDEGLDITTVYRI